MVRFSLQPILLILLLFMPFACFAFDEQSVVTNQYDNIDELLP